VRRALLDEAGAGHAMPLSRIRGRDDHRSRELIAAPGPGLSDSDRGLVTSTARFRDYSRSPDSYCEWHARFGRLIGQEARMKLHPTALVVAAVVVTGLTGCGAVAGSAAPTGGTGGTVSAGLGEAAADDAQPAATSQQPKHRSTPKPHTGKPHTPKAQQPKVHGPRIVSFKVVQKPKCAEGTAVFRAEAVPLIIKWKITGADSAALSVDDPTGTPGTYGPVENEGTQEFTFSCAGEVGSTETHTYAIYTVGGGAQRHKTLKVSAKVLDRGPGTD
jgi:hypothetical protein